MDTQKVITRHVIKGNISKNLLFIENGDIEVHHIAEATNTLHHDCAVKQGDILEQDSGEAEKWGQGWAVGWWPGLGIYLKVLQNTVLAADVPFSPAQEMHAKYKGY